MSNVRKGRVTLFILGVKGHTFACFCNTGRNHQKPASRYIRWEFPPNMAVHEQLLSALADQTGTRVNSNLKPVSTRCFWLCWDRQRNMFCVRNISNMFFRDGIPSLSSSYNISGLVPACWSLFQWF